jgi:hypothetical protein
MSNINSITKRKTVKVGNRTIGYFNGDRFIKPVIGSKHKLKYPPAWAIDAYAFDNEIEPNTTEIVIQNKETGTEYYASAEHFKGHKGVLDRGFGKQYFLTLNYWEERGNGHHQLSLWGGNDNG